MKSGYGQINDRGTVKYVHRVAYEAASGPAPLGLQVLHNCDNRRCVNKLHLFVGTLQDNMDDMTSKRRQAHGARCFHAKLTAEQVQYIRSSCEKQAVLADRFGVTQSNVSFIRSEKSWLYV